MGHANSCLPAATLVDDWWWYSTPTGHKVQRYMLRRQFQFSMDGVASA